MEGEGDFGATVGVKTGKFKWHSVVLGGPLDTGSRPSVVDD